MIILENLGENIWSKDESRETPLVPRPTTENNRGKRIRSDRNPSLVK